MGVALVIGIRGKTGREVASALQRREGVSVRGAGRHLGDGELPGVAAVRFDWNDPASWVPAIEGVQAIFLVKPKTAEPAKTVEAFLRLADGVERVVLLSEIDAGSRDVSTTERSVEVVVQSSRIGWSILRPNWFMQNFTEPSYYLPAIRNGVLEIPTAGQSTSVVDTRDIGEAAAECLLDSRHSQQIYTLTGPEALTWADMTKAMGEAARHEVTHVDVPLEAYLDALSKAGTSKPTIEYYRRVYSAIQDGRTSIISPDVQDLTGHPPRSFFDFISENREVWQR